MPPKTPITPCPPTYPPPPPHQCVALCHQPHQLQHSVHPGRPVVLGHGWWQHYGCIEANSLLGGHGGDEVVVLGEGSFEGTEGASRDRVYQEEDVPQTLP